MSISLCVLSFFGKGFYVTTYAEYAARYAMGMYLPPRDKRKSDFRSNANGEYVMIVSYVSPGACYPISRKTDYPSNGGVLAHDNPDSKCKFYSDTEKGEIPKAFVKGATSQYAVVNTDTLGCQAVNLKSKTGREMLPMDYDELAVSSTARLLPAFKIYFKKPRGP